MATPLCPYFGSCGGCSLQHVDYEQQVAQKKPALAKVVGFPEISIFSGQPYSYRNRVDFLFHSRGIGLRRKQQKDAIIDIERCAIAEERINALLQEVRVAFSDVDAFDQRKKSGTFRYAVIRTSRKSTAISFVLNADSTRINDAVTKIEAFAKTTSADHVAVTYVPKDADESTSDDFFLLKGSGELEEEFLRKRLFYPIQGFFQNNTLLAEQMHQYVRSLLTGYDTKQAHLLDLYGGVGAFSIVNADLFQSVSLVENFPAAMPCAKNNFLANGLGKKGIIHSLDARHLKRLSFPKPLFVITDPPRSGMDLKALARLEELQPEVIIYVSCNLQQLTKELRKLPSYAVKSAALFDFFPQTWHSEAVVELVRKA